MHLVCDVSPCRTIASVWWTTWCRTTCAISMRYSRQFHTTAANASARMKIIGYETCVTFWFPWVSPPLQHAGTDKSVFPLPEPQDFFQAAQVKFEDITKEARKLKRELTGRTCAVDRISRISITDFGSHHRSFKAVIFHTSMPAVERGSGPGICGYVERELSPPEQGRRKPVWCCMVLLKSPARGPLRPVGSEASGASTGLKSLWSQRPSSGAPERVLPSNKALECGP